MVIDLLGLGAALLTNDWLNDLLTNECFSFVGYFDCGCLK